MKTIQLHINGLTHHDIAARREDFVSTAVGRRMVLRAAPCREGEWAVAAYVGADMVGYVARLDLDDAWAAMKGSDFCERIATLPFTKPLNPECCYNNIRRYLTMSFMAQDARQLECVKPSRNDEQAFAQCRMVVQALAQELGKIAINEP